MHGRVAIAIVLYLAVVGIWGLVQGVRGFGPSGSFTGALLIAEVAAIAQGLFGVVLLFGPSPPQSVHILYGVALAVALPLAATLVRGRPPRAVSFAFAFMALFAAGLAIRGIMTK